MEARSLLRGASRTPVNKLLHNLHKKNAISDTGGQCVHSDL